MKSIRWTLAFVAAVSALSMAGWVALAEGEVGDVQYVAVWAYGTPPQGQVGDLFQADSVVADEVVETVSDGALHLRFLDGTEMRLGSSSRMTIDSFVYDQDQGTGEFLVDLGTGAFRIISGAIPSEDYQISTPVAVIGIRGSDVEIGVADNGETTVDVNSGTALIRPKVGAGGIVEVQQDAAAQIGIDGAVTDGGVVDDPGLQAASGNGSRRNRGGGNKDSRSD